MGFFKGAIIGMLGYPLAIFLTLGTTLGGWLSWPVLFLSGAQNCSFLTCITAPFYAFFLLAPAIGFLVGGLIQEAL